jgi:hypothetical protein
MTEFQSIIADVEDIAPVVIVVALIIINAVAALFKKAKEAAAKQNAEAAPTPLHPQHQQQDPAHEHQPATAKKNQAVQSIADFFGVGEALKIVSEPAPAPRPAAVKAKPKPAAQTNEYKIAVPHTHDGESQHRIVGNAMVGDEATGPSLGKRLLTNPAAARQAFIASEIFAPPKALRDDEPSWV